MLTCVRDHNHSHIYSAKEYIESSLVKTQHRLINDGDIIKFIYEQWRMKENIMLYNFSCMILVESSLGLVVSETTLNI